MPESVRKFLIFMALVFVGAWCAGAWNAAWEVYKFDKDTDALLKKCASNSRQEADRAQTTSR
jgi:hypothetical protein